MGWGPSMMVAFILKNPASPHSIVGHANKFLVLLQLGSGCSTVVEHTPNDPQVLGSISNDGLFSVNDETEQVVLPLPISFRLLLLS